MYPEKLEKLIERAIADGVLTEEKKQILLKDAEAEGIFIADHDNFFIQIEKKLQEKKVKHTETVESIIRSYHTKLASDHSNIYWAPDIPENKLSNAIESYILLDDDEQIIFLYDNTVFGSAKDGCCLSTKGLYWKAEFKDSMYICYSDMKNIGYEKYYMYINNSKMSATLLSEEQKTILKSILNDVHEYAKKHNIPSNTLEKLIRITFRNKEITEENKQTLIQKAHLLGIDTNMFYSVFNNIESSLPKYRPKGVTFDKITGRQAYLDNKEAKKIKADSEAKYNEYCEKTSAIQQDLNHSIEEYGRRKLETLKRTVGVFLSYLQRMEQRYKENYYELMDGCDFPKTYVAELGQLNMNGNELLTTAATTGGFAYAAVAGVPYVVTSAVGALATASTGTAIGTLSGAASTNAILAWLGGGAVAAGGGGIAAGTVVLAGITYTVTGAVALVTTGLVASKIYAKKLTQAQKYSSEVDIACEKMETSWVAMDGIKQRVSELMDVTMNVYDKCIVQLAQLEPVISCFDTKSKEHVLIFQKAALLIKSMSELAKTPLFGDDMNLSDESEAIITKTRRILNTEL